MADATALLASGAGLAMGAGLAIGMGAIGSGLSQGAIGSAVIGAAVEKPEWEKNVLFYMVIPESLIIFAFVIAILLVTKI
ncbi:MAG: V-type ATP synthase subunit K [Candidatus ainarchaeum sp.]|nr:V-type ATP synthase subunit K [Candidatus ainarchaeum sp.]